MADNEGLCGTIPHLGDIDAELFWHLASYVGGLMIEWGRLERAIDLIAFYGFQWRRRNGCEGKAPGDFSGKLKVLPEILAESEQTKGAIKWVEKQIPRILEIKVARDTLVHGYFGSVSDNPATITFNRRRFRHAHESRHSLSLSEADFRGIIKDVRFIEGHLAMYVVAFLSGPHGRG